MVEVAEYNMDRVKFVWQKIWNLMKDHFGKVGCHQDSSVGMFAVDSLKQLAAKFLRVNSKLSIHLLTSTIIERRAQ